MKTVHLTLKKLSSLVVAIAFITTTAFSQQIINSPENGTASQSFDNPPAPITTVSELPGQQGFLSVYPNPASGNITVQCLQPIHIISIVDILGRTIRQFQPEQLQVQINLDGLVQGRYFISVQQSGSTTPFVRSFIKI